MQPSNLTVLTVMGTRPELIRLSRIIPLLDAHTNHVLVHTQQNFDYELNTVFFEELGIREPDYRLDVKADTTAEQIAHILTQFDDVLEREQPDVFFVLGDTNTALTAYLARRRHIPIFHMEAGNRSYDWHVPEEINRRIVDHISDVNLCYSEQARAYLLREGLHPGSVYVVGSPIREIFSYYEDKIAASSVLSEESLVPNKYFVASIHREENVDDLGRLQSIVQSLEHVAKTYDEPVLVSLHPRTRKRMEAAAIKSSKLRLLKPWGYFDFVKLQQHAHCVLSDSGSLPEESAVMGFPSVQVRVSTERPEAYDFGATILSGPDKQAIVSAVNLAVQQRDVKRDIPEQYMRMHVADAVVKLILGYGSVYARTDTTPLSL